MLRVSRLPEKLCDKKDINSDINEDIALCDFKRTQFAMYEDPLVVVVVIG